MVINITTEKKSFKPYEHILYKYVLNETYPIIVEGATEIMNCIGQREFSGLPLEERQAIVEKLHRIAAQELACSTNKADYFDKTFKNLLSDKSDFKALAEQLNSKCPYFYDNSKIWWIWNNSSFTYEMVDEVDIMNKIDEACNLTNSSESYIKTRILEELKKCGRKNIPVMPEKEWIQFGSRIIDYESTDERESYADSSIFFTNTIPWNIGTSVDTPTMDRLFTEWVGKENVQTLYEILAYSCLSYQPFARIICLLGNGANGKSTFIKVMRKFLGDNNISSTSLDNLNRSNFATTKLFRKLAIVVSEVDKNVIRKTALLKQLTGDDLTPIEFKGKDGFDFTSYATPIMCANKMPASYDESDGYFRRWLIIDFPNQFPEKAGIIDSIPDVEYENLANKVPKILKELINRQGFHKEGNIAERREKYLTKSSYVPQFIEERCKKGKGEQERFADFYNAYDIFVREMDPEAKYETKSTLGKTLRALGYEVNFATSLGWSTTWIYGLKLIME